MNLTRVHRRLPKLKVPIRKSSQVATLEQNEYTETPEYPPITDNSLQARKLRDRQTVYQKIQKLNTVEEKQIALNMPRYYGWRCVLFHDDKVPYNALPLVKCYTRSHFIPVEKLPEAYAETDTAAGEVSKEIKGLVEDAIAIEHEGVDRKFTLSLEKLEEQQLEDNKARCIVRQINRIIANNLADKVPHILSAQTDYDPRHEAFWFVGGTDVAPNVIRWRKKFKWLSGKRLNENLDLPIQYLGTPFITVRNRHPLKPLVPYSEAENPEFKVPFYKYYPRSVGYFTDFRHGTNIPGFWPGEFDEFGSISYHGRGHIVVRKKSYGPEDDLEALHCQALKSSFGWLLAQANYQGFTTYNDITYPLVTQTVVTNGQLWSLYAYQLNTIVMHNEQMHENPKHNVCFGTQPLKLYDTIEDGKVKGLNEDVLKLLVQFYLNAPEKRDYNMKPYLGDEIKVVADIEDDNKRCWLENCYKHIVSNRPKHLLKPEVYLWERIYKIEHNTRSFEARRRPFELGVNPYQRRLNEHLPPYIPKVLRPYPRHGKKFESTYYPDV